MMKVFLLICLFLSFIVCDDFHTQCMDGFGETCGPLQEMRCKKAVKQLDHHHDPFTKPYFAKLENDIGRLICEHFKLLKRVSGLKRKVVPGPMGKVGECDKASFEKWMQERGEQWKTLEMRGKIEKIK